MIESATQSQPESALDHPSPQYIALIPAAGVGARMGHQCPKQYLQIGKQSVLQHTIQAFLATPAIQHVFVVVSPHDAYIDEVLAQLAQHESMSRLHILRCGGATRGLLSIKVCSSWRNTWRFGHMIGYWCMMLRGLALRQVC